MKLFIYPLVVLVLVGIAPAAWAGAAEEIAEIARHRAQLFSQGDLDGWLATYADDAVLHEWVTQVKALDDQARADVGPDPALPPAKQEAARRQQQHALERELWQLCAPYAHTGSPLQILCKRVERFLPELFVFVARPEVPSDNNLAERSVRPLVIARKISGGSRSPNGSHTRMGLFSCFGTWAAQGLNPFLQCLALLSQQTH